MKKVYSIKFSHVRENEYKAIVEAENYEQAMKIFERNPLAHIVDNIPSRSNIVAWNVSEVVEFEDYEDVEDEGKLVYYNYKTLTANYD